MKEFNRVKCIYAIYDVEMKMWTEPIVLRNDIEAKKLFKSLLENDHFNGCKVEFYKLGFYKVDSDVIHNPFIYLSDELPVPQVLRLDDTVEDDNEVENNE